jgi:REP element-mobilizing transposase RayT
LLTAKELYRRNLPHWHPEGQMFFITFRLANSLPVQTIQELRRQNEAERRVILAQFTCEQQWDELYRLGKKYFGHFDLWLDRCLDESPHWLADEKVAQVVADEIHHMDGERYRLIAFCLMPNHVHLLVDTSQYTLTLAHEGVTASYPVADTLKLLKGCTARYGNQTLGRTGAFWHHESYDHVVRDQPEFERIIWYIANNPVKAGLVKNWEDWKFTFVVSRN